MTCERCGQSENQPGVQPPVHVDTLTIRVNETVCIYRVALCTLCRARLATAIQRAVQPVGLAAA